MPSPGLGRLHRRGRRAITDRVDEAVREGGGGRFNRERPAGSDPAQLGAVDASSIGRGDQVSGGRPLRVGGDSGVDRLGEPNRRRFACALESTGFDDAPVEPPLNVAARTIVRGRSGRAQAGVGDVRAARQMERSQMRLGSLSVGTAQAGAVSGVQLVAAARTAVPSKALCRLSSLTVSPEAPGTGFPLMNVCQAYSPGRSETTLIDQSQATYAIGSARSGRCTARHRAC